MTKQTGLAAFTTGRKAATTQQANMAHETAEPAKRQRAKGEVVALTVRLPRSEWERVHQLAVTEGTSIQQLALKGLSKIFAEKGLPEIQ